MEYKAGQVIERSGKPVLIHRVVNSDSYFFDRETQQAYILHELYLETRDSRGDIGFIGLSESRDACEKAEILGPDTLSWRKVMSNI